MIASDRGGWTLAINIAGLAETVDQRLVHFVCAYIATMEHRCTTSAMYNLGDRVFLLAPVLAPAEVNPTNL